MKTQTIQWIAAGKRKRQQRWLTITGSLIILAVLLCGAMLLLGHTIYPVSDVIRVLLGDKIQGCLFCYPNHPTAKNAVRTFCWICLRYSG